MNLPKLAIGTWAGAALLGLAALGLFVLGDGRLPHPAALAVAAQLASPTLGRTATPSVSPTPSATPFRPVPYTATPSPTATATFTLIPSPTASATLSSTSAAPAAPPDSADTALLTGHTQALNLSCESRSAVDWAHFFGVEIGELEFLDGLPRSDNPEEGFVGNPSGAPGQVPPAPYGVHAAPVGRLLRAYGLPAEDQRGMSWDALRAAIAAGHPVITWVIGDVQSGRAQTYRTADGQSVQVAPFEHTVIVVGYTPDAVRVVDNALTYSVSLAQFLASWGVLGNQAVVYDP